MHRGPSLTSEGCHTSDAKLWTSIYSPRQLQMRSFQLQTMADCTVFPQQNTVLSRGKAVLFASPFVLLGS